MSMDVFKCYNNNCTGYLTVQNARRFLLCKECGILNCTTCRAIHEGISCSKFQQNAQQNEEHRENVLITKTEDAFIGKMKDASRNLETLDLSKAMDMDYVPSPDQFKCPKCNIFTAEGRGIILKECLHCICKPCFIATVKKSPTSLVSCPIVENSSSCCGTFLETEIKALVKGEDYQKHLSLGIQGADLREYTCATPNCGKIQKVDLSIKAFTCSECNKENCIACQAIHEGKTCEEHIQEVVNIIDHGGNESAEEKRRRFELELHQYEQNLVKNFRPFECPICFLEIEKQEGIALKNCHHEICRECLHGHIVTSETTDIYCPFTDGTVICAMEILDNEIKGILTKEEYKKHLELGLGIAERSAADSFHCKTVDCKGWCLFEPEINEFECPCCQKVNCLRCAAIHEGMNCKQYQDDLKRRADNDENARKSVEYLEGLLAKGEAMRCPNCKVVVSKQSGCDFMTCASCRTELCWATKGPRWGPKGRGDITGGCRCRVNNQKCHPNCINCH